jgi:asparagine synthase (glutamine-hydrolysing)
VSGIVGIIHLNNQPVDPTLLRRMNDFMTFRGPDAQTIWSSGCVGFGHTILKTTWEAEYEQQPFTLDRATSTPCERQVWIVADARIDDRENLAQKLEISPLPSPPFTRESKVITDVELILRAYLHWGDDCVQHLLGDFAFAIWDARHQRLFCARDQFGVKLFYYSQIGNCLLISNTIDCLRQHPEVSSNLNERAIGDFLLFQTNYDLETTTFTDIHRLPAAHTLTCSSERGLQTRKYWTLPMPELIRYPKTEDYLDRFQELMGTAVGDRLRMDRVSSSFSGGLDSTTIAATALAVSKQKSQPLDLKAFVVVYDTIMPDRERYYAGLAANKLGISIDYQVGDDNYPYENCDLPRFQTPEPTHHPFWANNDESFRRGEAHSRILLNGQGSDEAFISAKVGEMLQTMPLSQVVWDIGRSCLKYGVQPHWGSGLFAIYRHQGQSQPDDFPNWLNPDFVERMELKERWQQINSADKPSLDSPRSRAGTGFVPSVMTPFLESYDPQFIKVAVETRFPFFDLRLLDYLLALPPVPWCVNKMLLRTAMRQILPEEVRLRPKSPLAGDQFLAKGMNHLDRRSILQLSPQIETYIAIDRLLAVRDPVKMWDWWQHLVPLSLSYWLARYLDPVNLPQLQLSNTS